MRSVLGVVLIIIFALVLLGIVAWLARALLSLVSLGAWACRHNWHWWRDFPVHTSQGLASRTTTYLAWQGSRIRQCRTCEVFDPPAGEAVCVAYGSGQIEKVGGGFFSDPKLRLSNRPGKDGWWARSA